MRYLFFDIECADGNRAICEYGLIESRNFLPKMSLKFAPH